MKSPKIIGLVLLALLLGATAIDLVPWSDRIATSLVGTAEARVGRPLTPVSYAGVARRTVRRCAAGVYHC